MLPNVNLIPLAKGIALGAHAGVTDYTGAPYFGHVERVAENVKLSGVLTLANNKDFSVPEIADIVAGPICVAYLHDVLEDTKVTEDELRRYFPPLIVDAVLALTHRPDESRVDYWTRVNENKAARIVKKYDWYDNSDPERLSATRKMSPGHALIGDRLESKYAEMAEFFGWSR